jgi:hypothetical protein
VKAALTALAVLAVLCRVHVALWLYGVPVASVPVAALLLAAVLALCGAAVVLWVLARRRDWLRLAVAYNPGGTS